MKFPTALLIALLLNVLPLASAAVPTPVSSIPGGHADTYLSTYANPFRKWVRVEVPQGLPADARLELYDGAGFRVKVVAPASSSHFIVEQGRLASGCYRFDVVRADSVLGHGSLFFGD